MFTSSLTIFNDPRGVILGLLQRTVLLALLHPVYAQAATVCVSTAGQLNTAIIAAETNNQADDIRIRTDTYVAP